MALESGPDRWGPPPDISLSPLLSIRLVWDFLSPLQSILILDLPEGKPASTSRPVYSPLFDSANKCIHPIGYLPATVPPASSVCAVFDLFCHYESFGGYKEPTPCLIKASKGQDVVTVEQFVRKFSEYIHAPGMQYALDICGADRRQLYFEGSSEGSPDAFYSDTESDEDEDKREKRRMEIREEKKKFEGVGLLVVEYASEAAYSMVDYDEDGNEEKVHTLEELLLQFKNRQLEEYRLVIGKERGEIGEEEEQAERITSTEADTTTTTEVDPDEARRQQVAYRERILANLRECRRREIEAASEE